MMKEIGKELGLHLFYGGPFSQWMPCRFVIDDVAYNCAEQYMMAQKASLFGDNKALEKIMRTTDPSLQKATGRKVVGFDRAVWDAVSRDVVARASLAKFTSSAALYRALMSTRGQLLVEASASDCIWGIGLAEYDADAFDRNKWRGTNWLGQVLTDLREQLGAVSNLFPSALI
jgi:ribA/ribD-fused uncharacterized protein